MMYESNLFTYCIVAQRGNDHFNVFKMCNEHSSIHECYRAYNKYSISIIGQHP